MGQSTEVLCNGSGVQRGRHHNDAKIGTRGALQLFQQGQGEVALQVALVKFVEDHDACVPQRWIAKYAASQNAFGQEEHTCAGAADVFEADLISDRFAGPLA